MAKVLMKTGVEPRNLYILAAVANVAAELKNPAFVVVTAGVDGKHATNSKHYKYAALDVRSKNFRPEDKESFLTAVLERLGKDYTGFVEAKGTDNEHYHIQFNGEV